MHAADSPQQLIYTVLFLHGPHHRAKFWEVEKPNKEQQHYSVVRRRNNDVPGSAASRSLRPAVATATLPTIW
jgi:hypothetical protein